MSETKEQTPVSVVAPSTTNEVATPAPVNAEVNLTPSTPTPTPTSTPTPTPTPTPTSTSTSTSTDQTTAKTSPRSLNRCGRVKKLLDNLQQAVGESESREWAGQYHLNEEDAHSIFDDRVHPMFKVRLEEALNQSKQMFENYQFLQKTGKLQAGRDYYGRLNILPELTAEEIERWKQAQQFAEARKKALERKRTIDAHRSVIIQASLAQALSGPLAKTASVSHPLPEKLSISTTKATVLTEEAHRHHIPSNNVNQVMADWTIDEIITKKEGDKEVHETVANIKELHLLLDSLPISSIPLTTVKNVVCLTTHNSIRTALDILAIAGISSAPVVNPENHKIVGQIDVLDLVSCILDIIKKKGEEHVKLEETFNSIHVSYVLAHTKRNPFIVVDMNTSLKKIIMAFGLGVHRLLIYDQRDDLTMGVLTQTDALRIFYNYPNLLGSRGKLPLKELNFYKKDKAVITITPGVKIWHALELLNNNYISAVAVVNDKGEIINELSSNSIKVITMPTFHYLFLTVEQFLLLNEENEFDLKLSPVICDESEELGNVLSQMIQSFTHRAWVVDSHKKLIGLITMTDLLRYLIAIESVPIGLKEKVHIISKSIHVKVDPKTSTEASHSNEQHEHEIKK